MARKKCKGTRLKVFSGKEASLNRVIFHVLEQTGMLVAYDVWLRVKIIKGFRSVDFKTVSRRIQVLEQQGWISQKGVRPSQPGWSSALYELNLGAKAALRLDKRDLEDFLRTATDEQLRTLIDLLS